MHACRTTPSVVPTPRTSSLGSDILTGLSVISPGINAYSTSVAIWTTLFSTGAHAPGLNKPFMFRMAMNSADSP